MTSPQSIKLSTTEESSFKNADGQKIFTKYWRPSEKQPRALVFICHGFGGHCSRYEKLGSALADQGYLAFSHDHVGHGRSEGERVQVSDAGCYVRDVFQHIDQVTAINTGIPVFIFGHSMVFLAKIAAWIAPSYQVLPPIDPSLMSRDTEQVKKFANDPLNWHGGRKARWANAMLEALDKIQGKISTIKTPFLVANGDADQLTKMDSPRFLYENAPSSDKTFKVYKDCRHELLNELEESAEMFVKDILDWIKQRLP
ncbi:monoglyceride lipase-like isoform X4 [Oculina patagonica]